MGGVTLSSELVDMPECLVHHPAGVHPEDVTHPLHATGPNAYDEVEGPSCRACLFMRGPIRYPSQIKFCIHIRYIAYLLGVTLK